MSDPLHAAGAAQEAADLAHGPADEGAALPAEIDLPALAKEIYILLKEDLRHERERQGKP
jgi:hypothetical protein